MHREDPATEAQLVGQLQRRLHFALRAARAVAWEWDSYTGHVERLGDMRAIWGIPPDLLTDDTSRFFEYVHPDDRQRVMNSMRYGCDIGSEVDFRIISPVDGQVRWISDRHQVIRDEETGEARWIYGVSIDITPRKNWEQQLNALTGQLETRIAERTARLREMTLELSEAEHRERRRLVDLLHDELQQHLVAAKMRVDQARHEERDPMTGELLDSAVTLLNDAIRTSRGLAIELSPPALRQAGLAAALQALPRWMADRYNLKLQVNADPAANPQAPAVATMLYLAVRELLLNIVKHAGVDAATVTMERRGSSARLTVADAGSGFDPASLDVPSPGTIGLRVIQERLELVGGRFELDTAPGKGTRVTLEAPIGEPREAPPPVALPHAPADAGRRAGRDQPVRVVLVDDHHMVREGLQEVLARDPLIQVVGVAADGYEAIDVTRRLKPDLLVMDINMPRLDGVAATKLIKQERPDVRVVGLSLHDDASVAATMLGAGADHYVAKDAPPQRLIEVVHMVMAR